MHEALRFLPAGVLAAGVGLMFQAHNQDAVPLKRSLDGVLASVDGYVMRDEVISPEEQRVAGMSSFVARSYLRDTTIALTTLVSYYDRQTQGKTIHSPRNCLPGAGWEIVGAGTEAVRVGGATHHVNRYLLRNGQATAIAYYWYQGRGRVTANEYAVKWNLLRDAAILGHTEEALVRVVAPVYPADASDAARAEGERAAEAIARGVLGRMIREVEMALPGPRHS